MHYFAYGASLDLMQMRIRCRNARYVDKARLDGFRLCFPRRSRIRGSAVVGLEPAPGAVWGVVYDIADSYLPRLDELEGYDKRLQPVDNLYNRAAVSVVLSDGRVVSAETYVATPSADPGLPSAEYVTYLVQLAVAWELPEDYQTMLTTVETAPPLAA